MKVCVYDIVLRGEVVYVGMTQNPKMRAYGHKKTGVMTDGCTMVVHRWYQTREKARLAEKDRQAELKPAQCNDTWTKKKKPPIDYGKYRRMMSVFNERYSHEDVDEYHRTGKLLSSKYGETEEITGPELMKIATERHEKSLEDAAREGHEI